MMPPTVAHWVESPSGRGLLAARNANRFWRYDPVPRRDLAITRYYDALELTDRVAQALQFENAREEWDREDAIVARANAALPGMSFMEFLEASA